LRLLPDWRSRRRTWATSDLPELPVGGGALDAISGFMPQAHSLPAAIRMLLRR
jgi:hypothetical protein